MTMRRSPTKQIDGASNEEQATSGTKVDSRPSTNEYYTNTTHNDNSRYSSAPLQNVASAFTSNESENSHGTPIRRVYNAHPSNMDDMMLPSSRNTVHESKSLYTEDMKVSEVNGKIKRNFRRKKDKVKLTKKQAIQLSTTSSPQMKCGYLSKQNTGKWKRKRWHQRWFVLNHITGVLSYYKYASTSLNPNGTVREDAHAHGSLLLKGTSALMSIQCELPRGTPTPFCFNISVGSKALMVCADTEQDFREWTEAIVATINQDSKSEGYNSKSRKEKRSNSISLRRLSDIIYNESSDRKVC